MPSKPNIHRHAAYVPKVERQRQADKRRLNCRQRGYSAQWDKASKVYLSQNPMCVMCKAKGIDRAATCTDHIIPHKGDRELFWDRDNWQALCASCHSRKTCKEDGGYGR